MVFSIQSSSEVPLGKTIGMPFAHGLLLEAPKHGKRNSSPAPVLAVLVIKIANRIKLSFSGPKLPCLQLKYLKFQSLLLKSQICAASIIICCG